MAGKLSIGNKVSIHKVLGHHIPVVVVASNNLFDNYHDVHGVIGYDIFLRFEIELNAATRTITFRPAGKGSPPYGCTRIPLKIVDARPLIQSRLHMDKNTSAVFDLMIDTGSSLGLLLKTTNISAFDHHRNEKVLGIGLNGPVSGYQVISDKLVIADLEIPSVPTGIVSSAWHNNASIGMKILKHYIVILNYSNSYACLKPHDV